MTSQCFFARLYVLFKSLMVCLMLRELQCSSKRCWSVRTSSKSFFSLVFDVSESVDDAAISIFGSWCFSEK